MGYLLVRDKDTGEILREYGTEDYSERDLRRVRLQAGYYSQRDFSIDRALENKGEAQ